MTALREFYPIADAFEDAYLQVSDLHTLHYEQAGNPQGKPIIFLHGGPGAGYSAKNRGFFDPTIWRIILFDQRGSGRSTPHAELRENTTWDLVADIEKLRQHLGIDQWVVFGGSWGSALSLTYAISYPERVKGLILRGIFLCSPREIHWFYQRGTSAIYPDAWEKFLAPISKEEQHDLLHAYYRRLTGDNEMEKIAAAKAWSIWEAATSHLFIDWDDVKSYETSDAKSLAFARIEAHYFVNNGFFPSPDHHLKNIDKIRHIPTRIVQGRHDLVCPMETAWDLHRAFPEADFRVVQDAGHSALEPGNRSELIQATDDFKIL